MKNRHGQYPDKCKHFRGIQRRCKVGIDPMTLRESGKRMARWPCLRLIGDEPAVNVCPARELMTIAEHDAEEDEMNAALDAHLAKLAAGVCPECGKPIEPSQVIGRCKYAACGHRIGQVLSDEEYP